MRKVYLKSCLVLAVFAWIAATQALARDEEITARFTRQIDSLGAFYQAGGGAVPLQALGDALIDGKARNQLFRLEGLLRLYERAQPGIKKYRQEVKELEDGLGAYSFTADSLSFAKDKFKEENQAKAPDAARKAAQDKILETLKQEKDAARADFGKLVEKSKLGSDLPKLRSLVVSKFAGWSASKDLGYVRTELQTMLKDVRDSRLDFNNLEDGIHEFRRRLRWFPVVVDSLDGLVLLRDDAPGACPVPGLEALAGSPAAKHRYSNPALKFPATHPCSISRCLLWQAVKTTNDLGGIKDEAQGNTAIASALDDDIYVASKKPVTPEEIARAKAIRTELLSSKTLDTLIAQISSCKAQ